MDVHNSTNDSNSNSSDIRLADSKLFLSIWIFMFVFSLCGNVLVCAIGIKEKQLRSPIMYLILNLSVADTLLTLSTFLVVFDVAKEKGIPGIIGCKAKVYLVELLYGCSILTLVGAVIERYYAVCKPLKFNSFKRKAPYLIGATWVTCAALFAPELWACTVTKKNPNSLMRCECLSNWIHKSYYAVYWIFLVILLYVFPLVNMLGIYVSIVKQLWSPDRLSQKTAMVRNRQTKAITKMVTFLTVLFVATWTPVIVIYLFETFEVNAMNDPGILPYALVILPFVHCCVSPYVVIVYNRNLRRAIRGIILGTNMYGYQSERSLKKSSTASITSRRDHTSTGSESRLQPMEDLPNSFRSSCYLANDGTL